MRKLNKSELTTLITEISTNIFNKNSVEFETNAKEAIEGKTDANATIIMIALLYNITQKNCEETIIEVLDKILND